MRYLIFCFVVLLVANTVFAMDRVQSQLRQTPEMNDICTQQITYLSNLINIYQDIADSNQVDSVNQKLQFFKDELQQWEEYCSAR